MKRYRYVVNTFQGSEPVQRYGQVCAVDEWGAVNRLIEDGIVDPRGYEFLELKVETEDVAKEICDELGIQWDENATQATLNGEPVTTDVFLKSFEIEDRIED